MSDPFLAPAPLIDCHHPAVRAAAAELTAGARGPAEAAARCFRFVRDEVTHSVDAGFPGVTRSASEALAARSGFCYSKSHLLTALLRAAGIPAGLCYQRLSVNDAGPPYCLHALNAVLLSETGRRSAAASGRETLLRCARWYRVDARGGRPGAAADFEPPREALVYTPRLPGERTFPGVFAAPWPEVTDAVGRAATAAGLMAGLPDRG